MNETTVTIVGRVSTELTSRRTVEGASVVSFGVITSERRYDKEAGSWVDGHKMHAWVTCWRKLALGVVDSLKKGDPVIVTGRLYQDSYERDGETRTSLRLDAQAIGPNLSWCTTEVRRTAPSEPGNVIEPGPREPAFAAAAV
jgi:single-strand DNA-binding protein